MIIASFNSFTTLASGLGNGYGWVWGFCTARARERGTERERERERGVRFEATPVWSCVKVMDLQAFRLRAQKTHAVNKRLVTQTR